MVGPWAERREMAARLATPPPREWPVTMRVWEGFSSRVEEMAERTADSISDQAVWKPWWTLQPVGWPAVQSTGRKSRLSV